MNIDKQIEEMAILFAKGYCNPKGCDCCNLIDEYCNRELSCEDFLGYKRMAETFYEQGYRKASDVAREIFEEIDNEIKNHGITYAQRKIAELKKKYIGEDTNGTTKESEKDDGE